MIGCSAPFPPSMQTTPRLFEDVSNETSSSPFASKRGDTNNPIKTVSKLVIVPAPRILTLQWVSSPGLAYQGGMENGT